MLMCLTLKFQRMPSAPYVGGGRCHFPTLCIKYTTATSLIANYFDRNSLPRGIYFLVLNSNGMPRVCREDHYSFLVSQYQFRFRIVDVFMNIVLYSFRELVVKSTHYCSYL